MPTTDRARKLAIGLPRILVLIGADFMCFSWAMTVTAWWSYVLAAIVCGLLVPMTRGASSEYMEVWPWHRR